MRAGLFKYDCRHCHSLCAWEFTGRHSRVTPYSFLQQQRSLRLEGYGHHISHNLHCSAATAPQSPVQSRPAAPSGVEDVLQRLRAAIGLSFPKDKEVICIKRSLLIQVLLADRVLTMVTSPAAVHWRTWASPGAQSGMAAPVSGGWCIPRGAEGAAPQLYLWAPGPQWHRGEPPSPGLGGGLRSLPSQSM